MPGADSTPVASDAEDTNADRTSWLAPSFPAGCDIFLASRKPPSQDLRETVSTWTIAIENGLCVPLFPLVNPYHKPMNIVMCPACDSMNLRVSRKRTWLERHLLTWRGYVPLVCVDCDVRFYSKGRPNY
jgi:hypothetical protein